MIRDRITTSIALPKQIATFILTRNWTKNLGGILTPWRLMSLERKNISMFELIGYVLIIAGVLVLVGGFFAFGLQHRDGSVSSEAFHTNLGAFGEFIGGLVGSLWALAGVFLFFATLTYQKNEFELQRIELRKTQKIFMQQNFSTLFINLLTQHNSHVNALIAHDLEQIEWRGNGFFIFFKEKVMSSFSAKVRTFTQEQRTSPILGQIFSDYFIYHYSFYQNMLMPYLKNLKVMFDMILKYRYDTLDEEEYYSFMTKSTLTPDELFLLYHLVHFEILKGIGQLEEEFGLFDNLPQEDKVENIIGRELLLYRH